MIAQLVLEEVEETVLSRLSFTPTFFKRYVDDCILAIPYEKIDEVLSKFNSYHPKIQFTLEKEENNNINFLDLSLSHSNNRIITKFFQKPTNSGRYLNFLSSQHISQKRGVVISLVDRAIHLTSPQFRTETLNKIKLILENNNYPVLLIQKIIKQRLHRFYNKSKFVQPVDTNKNIKYICVPFIQNLSQKLNQIVKPYNFKLAYSSTNNFNCFFSKLKDKVPLKKQTHVVYRIPCKDCDKLYIGQTTQHLDERLNGHKFQKNVTALKKHIHNTGHSFDFDQTSILNKETNNNARSILEMIQIKKHKNAINDKKEIGSLSNVYYPILIEQ